MLLPVREHPRAFILANRQIVQCRAFTDEQCPLPLCGAQSQGFGTRPNAGERPSVTGCSPELGPQHPVVARRRADKTKVPTLIAPDAMLSDVHPANEPQPEPEPAFDALARRSALALSASAHQPAAAQAQAQRDLQTLEQALQESERRGQRLQTLALSDALTGLSNRVHFERALTAELGHAMRMDHPFTLLLLDLDGFKAINDGFGHAAGDEVLREVSQRITQQMRLGDVLARLGGDEFGIVMRDGSDDAAKALARRIVKAVSQPITLGSGDEVGVGVSIGLAAYANHITSVRTLMGHADQALYQAKKQNERRWKMFVGMRA